MVLPTPLPNLALSLACAQIKIPSGNVLNGDNFVTVLASLTVEHFGCRRLLVGLVLNQSYYHAVEVEEEHDEVESEFDEGLLWVCISNRIPCSRHTE